MKRKKVDVDEKGEKDYPDHQTYLTSLKDGIFELISGEAKVKERQRKDEKEVIRERILRNELSDGCAVETKPIGKKEDGAEQGQEELAQTGIKITQERKGSEDQEDGNEVSGISSNPKGHRNVILTETKPNSRKK